MKLYVRRAPLLAVLLAAAAGAFALRGAMLRVGEMVLGAAGMCFLAAPLARRFERRLARAPAALAAMGCVAVGVGAALILLLPGVLRELIELAKTLPCSLRQLSGWMEAWRGRIEARLPGVALPALDWSAVDGLLSGVASGALGLVVDLAGAVGRVSMMAVLACFFLVEREQLLLRLELLLPRAWRHTAVSMGNAVCRALRLYLGGQLMIAGTVAALSVAALALIGVRSAPVLGLLIGLLNMIPYFGPFIGGAPAVLIALGDGWQKAALTLGALIVVQQLDGSWISPRIMGSLTGFSPALVLVGVYAGAVLGGIGGMLFALPVMLTVRTVFRVFVQKCENI